MYHYFISVKFCMCSICVVAKALNPNLSYHWLRPRDKIWRPDLVRYHGWAALIAVERNKHVLSCPSTVPIFLLVSPAWCSPLPRKWCVQWVISLTGQRKTKWSYAEIILRWVSKSWRCHQTCWEICGREVCCRARHSGMQEAGLSHWLSRITCLHITGATWYCR